MKSVKPSKTRTMNPRTLAARAYSRLAARVDYLASRELATADELSKIREELAGVKGERDRALASLTALATPMPAPEADDKEEPAS